MRCEEAQELITALVDRELSQQEQHLTESHIKECNRCRLAFEYEKTLKEGVRSAAARVEAPADLKERILSQTTNSFPNLLHQGWQRAMPWAHMIIARPVWAVAALVVLLLPVFTYLWLPGKATVPGAVLETHKRVLARSVQIQTAESSKALKEMLLRSVAGRFGPMGYDFSAMGLKATGGFVEEIGGRKVLVTIYEGAGQTITCFTFLGTEKDAPPTATVYFDQEKRMNFYSFSQGRSNAVLHRTKERICILVSEMPMADLLSLARSKAQPS